MREIILSQGKVALVDDEDFDYLNQWKWYPLKIRTLNSSNCYAKRQVKTEYGNYSELMHRVIMQPNYNEQIDHIDHCGLNNQKSNLRICKCKQNRMNQRSYRGRSKYKGIRYVKEHFAAQIGINNKTIHLGIFNTEKEAAKAYDEAAKKYHGEYAYLNFQEIG